MNSFGETENPRITVTIFNICCFLAFLTILGMEERSPELISAAKNLIFGIPGVVIGSGAVYRNQDKSASGKAFQFAYGLVFVGAIFLNLRGLYFCCIDVVPSTGKEFFPLLMMIAFGTVGVAMVYSVVVGIYKMIIK